VAKRKALLVGVNDYAPIGAGGPDLHGCVPDVADMANTLNALGIVAASPGTMRILTNGSATRANILTGIRWLITGAAAGDVLVFYYSGHGTYVVDTSGDEADHKDECICPHDFASAGPIKDDDIRALLGGLPATVNLDVIFDSCFSGSATRELVASAPLATIRFVEPPLDHSIYVDTNPRINTRGVMRAGSRAVVPIPGLNHVLWAACRDNQTSAEASMEGGPVRGVFTYCFCKVLRRAGVSVTRRQLEALVAAYVRSKGFPQVLQLEGTVASIGQKVFT
jgi:metacaspase-1